MGSVILYNEELKEVFYHLSTIENILQNNFRHVRGNKSYIDNLVISDAQGLYSKKLDVALKFVDSVTMTNYEAAVIILIATFENIAFTKYRGTYGQLKITVKDKVEKPLSYHFSREQLVNDSYDKLSQILKLIDGHIDAKLFSQLDIIKQYRDYLAHGKRFSAPPATKIELSDIAKVLDDVLQKID